MGSGEEIQVAGRPVRKGSVGDVGYRIARALYSRWRRLSKSDRDQLEPLADDVRTRALDLRGETDCASAQRDLSNASQRLADALVDSASADPEVSREDVDQLRDDLARELARLASADVKASRQSTGRLADAPTEPHRSG